VNALQAGVWMDMHQISRCRVLKAIVDYIDSDGIARQVELSPTSDVSTGLVTLVWCALFNSHITRTWAASVPATPYIYGAATSSANPIFYKTILSELPPSNSEISGLVVNYQVNGTVGTAGIGKVKPFVYVNGAYYYGDEYDISSTAASYTYEWVTNPATGLPWTLYDLASLVYGLTARSTNTSKTVQLNIHRLYADITYSTAPEITSFTKLPATIESLTLNTQNPITPDDLKFYLPRGNFLPERTEIILFWQGATVWQGIVWQVKEKSNETYIWAKSQQILLDYRYIPQWAFFCVPWTTYNVLSWRTWTIGEMLSDEAPEYCGWRHRYRDSAGSAYSAAKQNNSGIFFILNSALFPPAGSIESTTVGKYAGIANLIRNRALYHFGHYPLYTTSADDAGGLHRLRKAASSALALHEFYLDENDLYVYRPLPYALGSPYHPDAMFLLADHWNDTHIRPGECDFDEYYLQFPYNFGGQASKNFDDFFERMGCELAFIPDGRGKVLMTAKEENARGSEAVPLQTFVHGRGCKISKSIPSKPAASCVVAEGDIPQALSDWKNGKIIEIVQNGSYEGPDMRDYLDFYADIDESTYKIESDEEEYLLRPGDWIAAQAKDEGPESARVSKITIAGKRSLIVAGKSLQSINDQWGAWRAARGSLKTEHVVASKTADLTGPTGSTTFLVYFSHYGYGTDWACRLDVSWQLWKASGVTAEYPCSMDLWLRIVLNGKVIPPGRFKVEGNTGSLSIDITDFCSASSTADTTNTIAFVLANGVPASTTVFCHKISATISQIKRIVGVVNVS